MMYPPSYKQRRSLPHAPGPTLLIHLAISTSGAWPRKPPSANQRISVQALDLNSQRPLGKNEPIRSRLSSNLWDEEKMADKQQHSRARLVWRRKAPSTSTVHATGTACWQRCAPKSGQAGGACVIWASQQQLKRRQNWGILR